MRGPRVYRLGLLAVAAATLLAVGAAGSALAGVVPGYPHSHYCPSFKLDRAKYQVTVLKGHVRCRTARRVLRDFLNGGGTMHGPPSGPAADQYWTLPGGWKCGHGAGGGGCIRGGRNYKVAKQFIEADFES